MSVESNGAVGVIESTKHALPRTAMSAGTLSPPMTALVEQSVWLYLTVGGPGSGVASEMPTWTAGFGPALMMVANTVAVTPTCTERLDGNTAATRAVGGGGGSGDTVKHSPA